MTENVVVRPLNDTTLLCAWPISRHDACAVRKSHLRREHDIRCLVAPEIVERARGPVRCKSGPRLKCGARAERRRYATIFDQKRPTGVSLVERMICDILVLEDVASLREVRCDERVRDGRKRRLWRRRRARRGKWRARRSWLIILRYNRLR